MLSDQVRPQTVTNTPGIAFLTREIPAHLGTTATDDGLSTSLDTAASLSIAASAGRATIDGIARPPSRTRQNA